jgi:hypothetical protein
MEMDCDPNCEHCSGRGKTCHRLVTGLARDPATLRVKLRLAMPNGTELSDVDVLVDTGSEPD